MLCTSRLGCCAIRKNCRRAYTKFMVSWGTHSWRHILERNTISVDRRQTQSTEMSLHIYMCIVTPHTIQPWTGNCFVHVSYLEVEARKGTRDARRREYTTLLSTDDRRRRKQARCPQYDVRNLSHGLISIHRMYTIIVANTHCSRDCRYRQRSEFEKGLSL